MITILIASMLVAQGGLTCPVSGKPIVNSAADIDYNGVRYSMCCGNCPAAFKKDPKGVLKNAPKGKTYGVGLFDPVSGARVTDTTSKGGTEDYHGVRYLFLSADDKKAFDLDPKTYTKKPKKEVLFCPVQGMAIASEDKAGAYVDVDGVRYYTCCTDCEAAMKKDPATYAAKVAAKAKVPTANDAPKS